MVFSGLAAPPSSVRVGSVFAGPNVSVVESDRTENAWYTTLRRLGAVPAPTFSDTCFVHWVLYQCRHYQGRDHNRDAVVAAGLVPAEAPANGAVVIHGGGSSMAGQDGVILRDIYASRRHAGRTLQPECALECGWVGKVEESTGHSR